MNPSQKRDGEGMIKADLGVSYFYRPFQNLKWGHWKKLSLA